jgi:UDP-N-acetylmuramoyl-tripeptide--D-alanyl-D-alanine ligase
VNTEMGVAAWMTNILRSEPMDSKRALIVEMGAYRIGEIALLCRIAKPTIGAITYVGNQHLSLFGSREAIIEGKGELFAALPADGRAFGNSDNDAFATLKKRCACPVTSVGTDRHADIQALDIEETANGIRFKALGTVFNIPIAGTHNVTGTLLAIAIAKELGLSLQEIATKLQTFKRVSRTFELKTVGDVTVLDDTYNSSPDSVRAAIEWAKKQPHPTKILVLEGIIELGDAEGIIHTELAKFASSVFSEAYAAHPRFLTYLRDGGFGERAQMAEKRLTKAEKGTLVVFAGRLSPAVMARFI